MNVTNIILNRCQIFHLKCKCNKFNFGWGSAPYQAGRAYNVPSDHLARFGEKGRERRKEKRKKRGGMVRERGGRRGRDRGRGKGKGEGEGIEKGEGRGKGRERG